MSSEDISKAQRIFGSLGTLFSCKSLLVSRVREGILNDSIERVLRWLLQTSKYDMNLKNIHFAVYEASLLCGAWIPVETMFAIIKTAYADCPEVVELFSDLEKDWVTETPGEPYKMVMPFRKRENLHPDFKIATAFATVGAATAQVEIYWEQMALAFLLKRKIHASAPTEIDLRMAQYLLGVFDKGTATESEFLSWSHDPLWFGISERAGSETMPEGWWESFGKSYGDGTPLRTRAYIEKELVRVEDPDAIKAIDLKWDRYSRAYDIVRDGE